MKSDLIFVLSAALAFGVGACSPGGPRLEVTWTGADTGRLSLPAVAEWCEAGKYTEIRGTRGDTGFAMAVFPSDTALSGKYTVIAATVDSVRPNAAVALRWADPNAVVGYRGDSGVAVLRWAADSTLAGEVRTRASYLGVDSRSRALEITATFQGLATDTAPSDCPKLLDPPGAGSVDSLNADDLLSQGLRP